MHFILEISKEDKVFLSLSSSEKQPSVQAG